MLIMNTTSNPPCSLRCFEVEQNIYAVFPETRVTGGTAAHQS